MNEQRNNGRGIFYGVIGVATLVVAIIGATFAYFTAVAYGNNTVISGNMASISFGVSVGIKEDPGRESGMIPMSNEMIEAAANNNCKDANDNAVCQIYEITVSNTSSAAMFVDGYVALAGGSGVPTDKGKDATSNKTTMRWTQVFPTKIETDDGEVDAYSTAGEYKLGAADTTKVEYTTAIAPEADPDADRDGFNNDNIILDDTFQGETTILGTPYVSVTSNFIRISDHTLLSEATGDSLPVLDADFDRSDYTSTLVLSQQLQPEDTDGDVVKYYILVWLSETGENQNPNDEADEDDMLATDETNFFNGVVTFNSAQGSEVTATFSGYHAVDSQGD